METYIFEFGKYKGNTIDQVAQENPGYLLWLSGATTKFSLKTDVKATYDQLKKEYPDAIEKIKEYVLNSKCKICLLGNCDRNENCRNSKLQTRNYHYHPYGKKD